eukprot:UN15167
MILLYEKKVFSRNFDWEYIIVDEAHRLKNIHCKLGAVLRSFNSHNRLLMTGTPLQNNLQELWSLLNFLLPKLFDNPESFNEIFQT